MMNEPVARHTPAANELKEIFLREGRELPQLQPLEAESSSQSVEPGALSQGMMLLVLPQPKGEERSCKTLTTLSAVRREEPKNPVLLARDGLFPSKELAGSTDRTSKPWKSSFLQPRPGPGRTWMCGCRGQAVPQTRAQRSSFLCAKNSGRRSTATRRPWKLSASAALPSSRCLSSADTGSTIGMLRFTTPSAEGQKRGAQRAPAAARPAGTAAAPRGRSGSRPRRGGEVFNIRDGF